MASEVSGIPLTVFEEPIVSALTAYTNYSYGAVTFEDLKKATELELTPDKPNSARSSVTLKHLGKVVGDLTIMVFAPGDGTGDESTFKLADLNKSGFPNDRKILPRSKADAGILSEAHLTFATKQIDTPNADPHLYSGSLDLLGLNPRHPHWLAKIGELGQTEWVFGSKLHKDKLRHPYVTLTVGHHQNWSAHLGHNKNMAIGERFGDPHAVYNPIEDVVQVCGFLAIKDEQHLNVLKALRAAEPDISTHIGPFKAGTFYRTKHTH